MIDLNTLTKLAKEYQIDTYSLLREYLQIRFLNEFYSGNSGKIYFKGGTALRLIFGSPRFSEDLDFTSGEDDKFISAAVNSTVKKLESEFPNIYLKKLKTLVGISYKLLLPTDIARQNLAVKLDFSLREKISSTSLSFIKTKLPATTSAMIEHMAGEEILTEKLRAILTRKKGRDYFDLYFLLSKDYKIDKKLVQKKLDYYKEKFSVKRMIETIKKADEKVLRQDLEKFLPKSQRKIIAILQILLVDKLTSWSKSASGREKY